MSATALARTQPITEWLTKPQAAQILNCSREWIDRLISKRLIATRKQPRQGMRPIALVNPEDVERLRAEQATPALLVNSAPNPRALEYPKPPPLPPKPFLELHAAAEFCGLPYRLLLKLIARDFLAAVPFNGVWYVSRRDLEGLELGARKVRNV